MRTKSSVEYSRGMGKTRCKNCTNFRAPDSCSKVIGKIDPEYWCELFRAKR